MADLEVVATRLAVLEKTVELLRQHEEATEVLRREELTRRLEILNNEAKRLKEFTDATVTRERYEAEKEAVLARLASLEIDRATLAGKASQSSVTTITLIAVCGIILSVAGVIVSVVQ